MTYPALTQQQLEQLLYSFLPKEEGPQLKLISSMNYSLKAGGKRLRPRFMLELYRLLGGNERCIEPFMAAMEMIHTYSLCHDDLPAMDNDTLRRGKPTTWSVYGEDFGILAGDGLLTYAFETAAKACSMTEHPERCARALAILAEKAGVSGMAGGQAVDVELTGQKLTAETLDFIYRLKTAALIEASLMIGAVLADNDDDHIRKAEELGRAIGLAFQIRDDILDVISTAEELGKPIGSDTKNEKSTYVTLYGLEKAEEEVKRLTAKAEVLLKELAGEREASYFATLIQSLENRKS